MHGSLIDLIVTMQHCNIEFVTMRQMSYNIFFLTSYTHYKVQEDTRIQKGLVWSPPPKKAICYYMLKCADVACAIATNCF